MEKVALIKTRKRFGQRVRELRKLRGYSQESFAHECDIHRTYIGDVERGQRNIALDNIARIAATLNVSLSELFEGVQED